MNIKSIVSNKEGKNASWIIVGKATQMLISFVVSIWTTRYLGPSNYGLISYVSAYLTFFTSLCTLGITSAVLINELTERPEDEGLTLGTTIILRLISSALSAVMIVGVVSLVDRNEPTTIWVAFLSSLSLVFQVFDTIEYWFQKRYLSKVTSISSLLAYTITALYKVYLLITGKSVLYFAVAMSIDYIIIAICLCYVYKRHDGPKLRFSWQRGKEILSKSYHFILSGMMVAIYGQTDRVMLKHMLSETEVGYYTLAYTLSIAWVFILNAIITSMSPTIVQYSKEHNYKAFENKNKQLYSIVFYISIFVSLCFSIFASLIIKILYGEAYLDSVQPLRVVTWLVAFSYLGVARDVWMVCENKQKYSKYMYLFAAILNVGLNYIFIPMLGVTGAAITSLVTQIFTSLVLPMMWKEMRPNVKLIVESMNPVYFLKFIRNR